MVLQGDPGLYADPMLFEAVRPQLLQLFSPPPDALERIALAIAAVLARAETDGGAGSASGD